MFGIAPPGQEEIKVTLQLAVTKNGAIGGTFMNSDGNVVLDITGAVDKKTQRVALKIEGNDAVVVETSLYNLTNDEVPMLVHFGPDRQEPRTLIRLKQPEGQEQP